jgi:hypothetical protein
MSTNVTRNEEGPDSPRAPTGSLGEGQASHRQLTSYRFHKGIVQSHAKLHDKAKDIIFQIYADKTLVLFHKKLLQFVC